MLSIIIGALLYCFSKFVTEYYTNIPDLQPDVIIMMEFLAIFHLADAAQAVTSGVLRGLGKTKHASIAGFISYWIISLPMEYLFAFHYDLGVLGLWIGMMFGSVSHAAIQ